MAELRRTWLRRVGALAGMGLALGLGTYFVLGFVSARLSFAPFTAEDLREAPRGEFPLAVPAYSARGVLSVHTERSHDALGSLDDVAGAAARAGLDFVVLGDHPGTWSDAGADVLRPVRLQEVLVVGGLELVIQGTGRVLVTGLDTLPRRWEGSLASLVERTGGRGWLAVVHPRSPRARERWLAPDADGVHGWEAMDMSEMARVRLADRWAGYHITSYLTAGVVSRSHRSLLRLGREGFDVPGLLAFDSIRGRRPLTLTAGLNHHPKQRLLGGLVPAYEPFFRTYVNHVVLQGPLPEDPAAAWESIARGLRTGSVYVSLGDTDLAEGFNVGVRQSRGEWVSMGEQAVISPSDALLVRVPLAAGRQMMVRVLRDGRPAAWLGAGPGETISWPVPGRGVYRVEVYRAGRILGDWRWNMQPWLLSNAVQLMDDDA